MAQAHQYACPTSWHDFPDPSQPRAMCNGRHGSTSRGEHAVAWFSLCAKPMNGWSWGGRACCWEQKKVESCSRCTVLLSMWVATLELEFEVHSSEHGCPDNCRRSNLVRTESRAQTNSEPGPTVSKPVGPSPHLQDCL